MEALKALGTTTKNTIVVELFPGLVATWPILFYGLKWYRDIGKVELGLDGKSLNSWEFIVSLLLLIGLYGAGHIISKLGARLEVRLGNIIIAYNKKRISSIVKKNNNEAIKPEAKRNYFTGKKFTKVWYKYLRIAYRTDYTPTLVRYYSGFISAFKFELNMVCALFLMNISLSILENDGWIYKLLNCFQILNSDSSINLLSPTTYSILTLITLSMIAYFLYESVMAIYEQHLLRLQFIKADRKLNKQ